MRLSIAATVAVMGFPIAADPPRWYGHLGQCLHGWNVPSIRDED
ncbi:hypothetical protein QFZ34_001361 [Phyllobacterium ifriqiyense]|uniref:Uncharacterized protein n=1 Tax=Phyllobacterium ifriqiyense TaxID=314238 RepID=A0ABU0S5Z5_9HYPH|nr:hypothetical protein [Phyllobacterium ifriqiyense]MDQ0996184.1 hypothetical protein [Phyllobacterium ifriqiyense]